MITDLLRVTLEQWRIIFGIVLLIVLSQILITRVLRIIFGDQLTPDEYLCLGIAGWLLPASIIAIVWMYIGWGLALVLLLIPFIPHLTLRVDPQPASPKLTFSLLTILLLSILLRLVFVSKTSLPSYFDSAQHYLFIKQILEESPTLTRYYHLGFHTLAAFIASAFNGTIAKSMLILGQMILATLPFALYLPIKHETKSSGAALFAVIISSIGWYMPVHAVNWGKYPALMSLGLIPFVLSLAYLLARTRDSQVTVTLKVTVTFGILITTFAHSRSLIVLGIAFLAWIISTWWQRLPSFQRALIFYVSIIDIAIEFIFIQQQTILVSVFDPYLHAGIRITIFIFGLSIFAQKEYPQLAFTCILVICFLLGSLFIPIADLVPGYTNLTLLDRPFVEMILFLPLSLLGGLGVAGILASLRGVASVATTKQSRNEFVALFAIALVMVNAFLTYTMVYPFDCCVIVGNDDIAAIDWLDTHLPPGARIGIAATTLKVLASDSFEGYTGSDAGIWITPLTDRSTTSLPRDSDFNQQAVLDMICQTGISHLYVGEIGQMFDLKKLDSRPEWYRVIFFMPRVKVYEVMGCS